MQLELQLGAVNIFLTPRQLHALIQLTDTFLTDSTKPPSMKHFVNDNDNDNDQASEYKAFNAMSGNLGLNQCWSSDPLGIMRFATSFEQFGDLNLIVGHLIYFQVKIITKAPQHWT